MSESEFQITQKQAAEFLNVSTKTISRYRKKGLPFKMILNPVTGKQEVRFRTLDLERWHEGRQLLATYGQEGNPPPRNNTEAAGMKSSLPQAGPHSGGNEYLAELLEVYKEQVQILREQLSDMREQLARRDRQIDDLMRMMVGFQLEYKPMGEGTEPLAMKSSIQAAPEEAAVNNSKKNFSRDELAETILRLRQRGKSYSEIARGLNHINVATLSGEPTWTEGEVQGLLPALVNTDHGIIEL